MYLKKDWQRPESRKQKALEIGSRALDLQQEGNHNCLSFALNSFLFNPSFPNSTVGIFQWGMILMSSLVTRSDTFKDKMSNVCENSSIIVNTHKMQILLGM